MARPREAKPGQPAKPVRSELQLHLKAFLREKEAEGKSRSTLDWWEDCVEQFVAHAGVGSLEELAPAHLTDFFLARRKSPGRHPGQGLSPHTLNNLRGGLRTFFRWLLYKGYVDREVVAAIPAIKVPRPEILPFEEWELVEFFKEARRHDHPNPRRKEALYKLLLDTGIRRGEACSARLDKIRWKERELYVDGKSGARWVPFSAKMEKVLRRYLEHERKPLHRHEQALFLNAFGRPLEPPEVTQECLRIVKRACIEREHTGPHTFRHTFAVQYLLAGGDLRSLQKILGHAKITTTEVYLNLLPSQVREQQQAYSPLERLKV